MNEEKIIIRDRRLDYRHQRFSTIQSAIKFQTLLVLHYTLSDTKDDSSGMYDDYTDTNNGRTCGLPLRRKVNLQSPLFLH